MGEYRMSETAEQRMLKGLRQLIDYNWGSEQQHYFEEGEPANHIFPVLQELNYYLETRENEPAWYYSVLSAACFMAKIMKN